MHIPGVPERYPEGPRRYRQRETFPPELLTVVAKMYTEEFSCIQRKRNVTDLISNRPLRIVNEDLVN